MNPASSPPELNDGSRWPPACTDGGLRAASAIRPAHPGIGIGIGVGVGVFARGIATQPALELAAADRASRGMRTCASGLPQPVTGSQPGPAR
jgi:hypothetical protein